MNKYKSDKGNGHHNYTWYYYPLFSPVRSLVTNVFELGLGTNNIHVKSNMGIHGKPGASLRGWKEFFPTAQVYGADIDKGCLFSEERIQTYFCDQTKPEIIRSMWDNNELKNKEFDIIIDDGLHEFHANVCFFENSIHKLAIGGVFIIEDILNYITAWSSQLTSWIEKYPNLSFRYYNLYNPMGNNKDNTLIIVKRLA